jgi:hypothetical protein
VLSGVAPSADVPVLLRRHAANRCKPVPGKEKMPAHRYSLRTDSASLKNANTYLPLLKEKKSGGEYVFAKMRLVEQAMHDAFRSRRGLPKSCALAYEALGAGPRTWTELLAARVVKRATLARALARLAEEGLIEQNDEGWRRTALTLDDVAARLGLTGYRERLKADHERRSLRYAKWVEAQQAAAPEGPDPTWGEEEECSAASDRPQTKSEKGEKKRGAPARSVQIERLLVAVPRPETRPDGIPAELKDREQWIVWRYEDHGELKPRKVPYDPRTGRCAKSNDPQTWATYAEALAAYQRGGYAGVGYEFSATDPYAGVDLDDCLDCETGTLAPWARTIVEALDTYCEISPSGRGVKLIARGKLHGRGKKYGDVEIYDHGRFFTLTGNRLPGTRATIEDRAAQVETLYREAVEAKRAKRSLNVSVLTDERPLKQAARFRLRRKGSAQSDNTMNTGSELQGMKSRLVLGTDNE